MPDIEHRLEVSATPDRIWPALTTAEGVGGWWTLGDAILVGDFGEAGVFRFQSRGVAIRLSVAGFDRPRHLAWRPIEANAPGGWIGTMISFDLAPDGDATRLRFAHRGFAADDEGYRRVHAGWAHYLGRLKQFVETGGAGAAR